MATNLALDSDLLEQVLAVSGQPTKKAAVTMALREFIARREQSNITELFGKLKWDETLEYDAKQSLRSQPRFHNIAHMIDATIKR